MKYVGLCAHRFRDNPEEKRFAEGWNKENEQGKLLDHLLDTHNIGCPKERSVREHIIAATVIQWLGSPVGQSFLEGLGYNKKKATK